MKKKMFITRLKVNIMMKKFITMDIPWILNQIHYNLITKLLPEEPEKIEETLSIMELITEVNIIS